MPSEDGSVKYDVFLSYASDDRTWCESLATRLRSSGLRVWFDKWELRPGDHLMVKLNEGLASSRRMVAVFTSDYFRDTKVWTLMEVFSSHHSDVLSTTRPLIPILRRECNVPPTLKPLKYVDFTADLRFEDSFIELLKALDISPSERLETLRTSEIRNRTTKEEPNLLRNPYAPYAYGSVVADPEMFFGRQPLCRELLHVISRGNHGECILLYGQKRSGKSSVLWNLAQQLRPPYFPVVCSFALLDFSAKAENLTQLLIYEMREALDPIRKVN